MDYRIGRMEKVKRKVKIMLKNLVDNVPILMPAFIILWILGYSLHDSVLTNLSSAFLGILFKTYLDDYIFKRKVRAVKPAILLELRYILVSLIENFARFYVAYFEFLKFYDLSRLFELIEKHKKDFPNYLIDELSPCMILYESDHKIYQENIKKITLEVKKMVEKSNPEDIKRIIEKSKEKSSLQDTLNHFHSLLEKCKEIKPAIKPIYMTMLSSLLNNLSVFDKDFAENIFYIWYEINELNRETEVLKGLSQPDLSLISLIRSISQRIERIAIKIDEILEKEKANL